MTETDSARSLLDVVVQYLEAEQWQYQRMEGQPVLKAGYRGERGTWIFYLRADDAQQRLVLHAQMGMNIPAQHRPPVIEFLNRANMLLPVGNLEMNVDSGEVRFRASVETPESCLSRAMLQRLVQHSADALDRFFPGVLAVVHGGLSPAAALARAETQPVENAFDR